MKILLVFCFCVFGVALGDLSVSGTKCGTLTCKGHQFCSQFDNQCKPCKDICEEGNHNYEPRICDKDCQDYIHDVRYVRTSSGSGTNFGGDTGKLYTLVSIALALVLLVIFALLSIAGYKLYKWSQHNDIKEFVTNVFKKSEDDDKSQPNGVVIANGKRDLRLDMPPPGVGAQSEMSPVTVTTSITTRRPAEDSALDYAYDNHAMSATPSPHGANKPTRESNF